MMEIDLYTIIKMQVGSYIIVCEPTCIFVQALHRKGEKKDGTGISQEG